MMCVNSAFQKAESEITAIEDDRSKKIFANNKVNKNFFFHGRWVLQQVKPIM